MAFKYIRIMWMKSGMIFLTFFSLIGSAAIAQKNFVEVKVTLKSGKVTEGVVDYLDWKNNPKEIVFKEKVTSEEVIILTPESVSNIEIPSKNTVFVGAQVMMDRSSDDLKKVTYNKEPEFKEYQVFLKELIKGPATLYGYYEGQLVKFFYKTFENDSIQQLVMKYYSETYGKVAINAQYRRQLWVDVACDDAGRDIIKNLAYETKALKKYFQSYNQCILKENFVDDSNLQERDIVIGETPKRDFFNLRLTLGMNTSRLSVEGNIFNVKYPFEFEPSLAINIGLEAEFLLPYRNQRIGILFEPVYSRYKSTDNSSNSSVEYEYIIYPVGVRYYPRITDQKIFYVNTHVIHSFSTNFQSNRLVVDRPIRTGLGISPSMGLALGFGANYGRIGIDFRYYTPRNIVVFYENWSSSFQTLSVGLNIKLASKQLKSTD